MTIIGVLILIFFALSAFALGAAPAYYLIGGFMVPAICGIVSVIVAVIMGLYYIGEFNW